MVDSHILRLYNTWGCPDFDGKIFASVDFPSSTSAKNFYTIFQFWLGTHDDLVELVLDRFAGSALVHGFVDIIVGGVRRHVFQDAGKYLNPVGQNVMSICIEYDAVRNEYDFSINDVLVVSVSRWKPLTTLKLGWEIQFRCSEQEYLRHSDKTLKRIGLPRPLEVKNSSGAVTLTHSHGMSVTGRLMMEDFLSKSKVPYDAVNSLTDLYSHSQVTYNLEAVKVFKAWELPLPNKSLRVKYSLPEFHIENAVVKVAFCLWTASSRIWFGMRGTKNCLDLTHFFVVEDVGSLPSVEQLSRFDWAVADLDNGSFDVNVGLRKVADGKFEYVSIQEFIKGFLINTEIDRLTFNVLLEFEVDVATRSILNDSKFKLIEGLSDPYYVECDGNILSSIDDDDYPSTPDNYNTFHFLGPQSVRFPEIKKFSDILKTSSNMSVTKVVSNQQSSTSFVRLGKGWVSDISSGGLFTCRFSLPKVKLKVGRLVYKVLLGNFDDNITFLFVNDYNTNLWEPKIERIDATHRRELNLFNLDSLGISNATHLDDFLLRFSILSSSVEVYVSTTPVCTVAKTLPMEKVLISWLLEIPCLQKQLENFNNCSSFSVTGIECPSQVLLDGLHVKFDKLKLVSNPNWYYLPDFEKNGLINITEIVDVNSLIPAGIPPKTATPTIVPQSTVKPVVSTRPGSNTNSSTQSSSLGVIQSQPTSGLSQLSGVLNLNNPNLGTYSTQTGQYVPPTNYSVPTLPKPTSGHVYTTGNVGAVSSQYTPWVAPSVMSHGGQSPTVTPATGTVLGSSSGQSISPPRMSSTPLGAVSSSAIPSVVSASYGSAANPTVPISIKDILHLNQCKFYQYKIDEQDFPKDSSIEVPGLMEKDVFIMCSESLIKHFQNLYSTKDKLVMNMAMVCLLQMALMYTTSPGAKDYTNEGLVISGKFTVRFTYAEIWKLLSSLVDSKKYPNVMRVFLRHFSSLTTSLLVEGVLKPNFKLMAKYGIPNEFYPYCYDFSMVNTIEHGIDAVVANVLSRLIAIRGKSSSKATVHNVLEIVDRVNAII